MRVDPRAPAVRAERPPDSLQVSENETLRAMHPAPLPPVDLSRVEHGPAPVHMTVDPAELAAAPQRWEDLKIEGLP